jgi:hypothetical protein
MDVPFVKYNKTNHAKLTFGRTLAIQSFVSSAAITTLSTIDPHCLSTNDKIILFASENGNGGKHAITDGQVYTITKIGSTQFSIPLDTSNCAITEGVCVIPEDLSLYSFTAAIIDLSSGIVGRTILRATQSSQYIEIEGTRPDDFDGLVPGRFLFAEGITTQALIKGVSKDIEDKECCVIPASLKKTVFLDRIPNAGETSKWRTESTFQSSASIGSTVDIATSTVTLSISGNKGNYGFEVYQSLASSTEFSTVLSGEWTI